VAAAVVDASKTAALPTGSYALAYTIAAVLCIIAAGMTFIAKAPVEAASSEAAPAAVLQS
jgi:hypothetical protein